MPFPNSYAQYIVCLLLQGFDVVQQVNALAKGMPENTAGADAGAQIISSGQLH